MITALILAALMTCTQAGSNQQCRACISSAVAEWIEDDLMTPMEAKTFLIERGNPACDEAYPTRPPQEF